MPNRKPKLLVISYLFAPNNAIGAVRPTKLVEQLVRRGYEVDVFTYGYTANDTFPMPQVSFGYYTVNPNPVPLAASSTDTAGHPVAKDSPLIYQLKRHYVTHLSAKRDAVFLKAFRKAYRETLSHNGYDVVFSTFGPLASLKAARYVKRKNPSVRWICDFRDPILVDVTPLLYRRPFARLQKAVCREADAIVAVSQGYLDRICPPSERHKAHMIPNGFDEGDLPTSTVSLPTDRLTISYVGALYGGKRDLSPLFAVIAELIEEGTVKRDRLCVSYAGTEFSVLAAQASRFGLSDILRHHGRLSRRDCLDLQFSSHALVLSTWNKTGEEGVFPGKFLEYMRIGRPILSVVDGDLPNSEVTAVIQEGDFGVSYEAAAPDQGHAALKDYLTRLYRSFEEGTPFVFAPKEEVKRRYRMETVTDRMEELLY